MFTFNYTILRMGPRDMKAEEEYLQISETGEKDQTNIPHQNQNEKIYRGGKLSMNHVSKRLINRT
jgi:hypothetical protein